MKNPYAGPQNRLQEGYEVKAGIFDNGLPFILWGS